MNEPLTSWPVRHKQCAPSALADTLHDAAVHLSFNSIGFTIVPKSLTMT